MAVPAHCPVVDLQCELSETDTAAKVFVSHPRGTRQLLPCLVSKIISLSMMMGQHFPLAMKRWFAAHEARYYLTVGRKHYLPLQHQSNKLEAIRQENRRRFETGPRTPLRHIAHMETPRQSAA